MSARRRTPAAVFVMEGLATIGARSATTGNRRERREAARVLRSIPDGAEWYIPPVPRKGWRR